MCGDDKNCFKCFVCKEIVNGGCCEEHMGETGHEIFEIVSEDD